MICSMHTLASSVFSSLAFRIITTIIEERMNTEFFYLFFFFWQYDEAYRESQLMWSIAKIRLRDSGQNMWEDQAGEWIY